MYHRAGDVRDADEDVRDGVPVGQREETAAKIDCSFIVPYTPQSFTNGGHKRLGGDVTPAEYALTLTLALALAL